MEYYSHNKEEDLINHYLQVEGPGRYIDIGAGDPEIGSNTYHFYKKGWKGLCLDPFPGIKERFKKIRPLDIFIAAAITDYDGEATMSNSAVIGSWLGNEYKFKYPDFIYKTPCMTMVSLLQLHPEFSVPDFISIDIESNEDKLLEKCNFDIFKPKLIVIESQIRGVDQSQRWRFFLEPLYKSVDYRGSNLYFIRNEE